MTYAFVHDVPADENIYAQIKELLPENAPGLIAHIAMKREGGLRYVDVWETEAQWETFRADHVEPAVGKVLAGYGIPHTHDDVSLQPVDVVDVWLGE
jgi:hypothetical protein